MPLSPTPAQAEASRRNGALSRGPATAVGKARSRRNNTRHNLHGPFRLLPGEDEAAHAALSADVAARYAPAGESERHWVEEIAFAMWRRRRLRAVEAAALAVAEGTGEPDGGGDVPRHPSLATLARYRARVERDHRLADEQLALLRAARPRLPRELAGAEADQLRWLADRVEERASGVPTGRGTDEPGRPVPTVMPACREAAPAMAPNRRERRRLAALARQDLRRAA